MLDPAMLFGLGCITGGLLSFGFVALVFYTSLSR